MSSISSDEIISILKNEIENFDQISKDSEVGTVVSVGDGIANIYGIEHAMYGEIVTFECPEPYLSERYGSGHSERYDRLHPVRIRCRDQRRYESDAYQKESRSTGWR